MDTSKLGDRMPDRKAVRFGDMKASKPVMPQEWEDMQASSAHMSEKWDGQEPSAARMSEKWDEMDAGSTDFSDKWNMMEQEGREDPYSMAPSDGEREYKPKVGGKSPSEDAGKVKRSTQHTEFGSTREI